MPAIPLQQLYIDGARVDATGAEVFDTVNPATGEVLARVQSASKADVDTAVASAQAGQRVWAGFTAMQRSRVLRRAVDILRARNDELADLETLDTGKPRSETRAMDIVTGADVLEYYAGLATAIEGMQVPLRASSFVYTRRELLGVVAGIGAWNYPMQIALWKSAPALAAGNAMMANFYSSGQVCTNGTRVFVHRSVQSAFEALVLERVRRIRMGDPQHPDTNFGPLVSQAHMGKVLDYIASGRHEGARLLAGGARDRRRAGPGGLRAAHGVHRLRRPHEDRAGGNLRPGDGHPGIR